MATEGQIIEGLIRRGLPPHVAQGVVANMIAESRLDTGINEIAPIVPGSRGGYGLNQWTGPRRRQYEAFAAERGVAPDDLDAQLDFTLWELRNSERRAGQALAQAQSAEEAARIYSEQFLRPGIPHMDRRVSEANRLAGMGYRPEPQNALATIRGPEPQQNALATIRPPVFAGIDPAAFQRQRRPVQYVGFEGAKVRL